MKKIKFSKAKGKPLKEQLIFYFNDENIQIKERVVVVLCSNRIEFNKLSMFLRQYIFNAISLDANKLKIFIPKDYIEYCKNSDIRFQDCSLVV